MDIDGDFSAYVSGRWAALVRSAIVLGCTPEDANDLVQTTLLRCYIAWRKVQRADDRDAYVYRILLNCFRDSRRRRWWGERPTATLPDRSADDRTDLVGLADAVHRALADLSEVNRQVVVLRHYAGLSEQQTADLLGIPAGTVKSRLSRAVAQLAGNPQLSHLAEGDS